jgi:hypothetical protein
MSVKEQFYNQRPAVLFDPRASQRIDPRFTFTRASAAGFFNSAGTRVSAPVNQPRIETDFTTGEARGLLLETTRTNLINYSASLGYVIGTLGSGGQLPTGWGGSVQAGMTLDIIGGGEFRGINYIDFRLYGTPTNSSSTLITPRSSSFAFLQGERYRYSVYAQLLAGSLSGLQYSRMFIAGFAGYQTDLGSADSVFRRYDALHVAGSSGAGFTRIDFAGYVGNTYDLTLRLGGLQLEKVTNATDVASSWIFTNGTEATRASDFLAIDTLSIPSTGSIYIDVQANSAAVNDTLLSVANSSDEKLLLQTQAPASLYNSLALVYAIDDTFEPTLPFPVSEPGDQRNIITWGDNNYHYQKSNYRKTPSLTASIPENLDRIGIGHDVTDPTKGFNGTLARLYLWASELPPEIARGLVRGNITVPLNADDGNVIPVAAHALIFNTQGAAFNGDKVVRFQLLGSNNSVSIDWNDGIIETYAGSAANTTISHTYETPGLYLVTITGVFENIKLAGFTGSQASDLVNVAQNGPDWSPTNLTDLYNGCTLLKNEALDDFPDTSLITQYVRAFQSCSSLTSFPLINTATGTNFSFAWLGCSSLTSFPLINTAAGTTFFDAWLNCSSLTSFPLINTAAGTAFQGAWLGCSSLTSFPLINTAAGTNFGFAWSGCSSLTSFPLINTAAGTSFSGAWRSCSSLTSFPLINTAAGTNFSLAWRSCSSLTSFPLINTAAGTTFFDAWLNCSSLTSFPLINTAAGTNFGLAWQGCSSLTAFPALDFDAAVGLASDASNTFTGFRQAWQNCTSLADFPANRFDNTTCTRYLDAFNGCALTAQSIENILVSINTANTSNGNLSLQGGTNAVKTSWTANANTAYDALVARGWTITFRP